MNLQKLKIALVHEYLVKLGGGERVLKALSDLFPWADIFSIIYNPKVVYKILKKRKQIHGSFLQNFPLVIKKYQFYLWLMPIAVESFDLAKYDIVISDSHSFGKGIKVPKNVLNICYCYTPTRYLWLNSQEHLEKSSLYARPIKKIIPAFLKILKKWDLKAAARPDIFVSISRTVQKRVKKYYNRDSQIIYSPIDWDFFKPTKKISDFFLYVSRLEPHKKPELAITAFNKLKLPLKVVGKGSLAEDLKKIAQPNIEFLGEVSDLKLRDLYSSAKAVIFPQEEDLGLIPLEAAACGTPTIAFKKGGATETVIEGITGEFFRRPTAQNLAKTVQRFNYQKFNPIFLRKHAKRFSIQNFQKNIQELIKQEYFKKENWRK